ncbi:MAG TPA: DNA polymerase III subunit delta' [Xanthobacteraceae bacterium]|nr:DNA polymerase III subunit delta' [Xanthobacteraceae bacterium]
MEEADRLDGAPHPRETKSLYGHDDAEVSLLTAWNVGRFPHALLIGGPEGIGKATLAYRVARFVLAGSSGKDTPASLDISPDHPVSRQVEALAHPDLLVLRRVWNEDTKKLRSEIRVEDVRRTVTFFGSTPAYGGYRVCIVDSADELNRAGANALLKVLEEPPANSLLIIISHSPGRLLPTIRSRCRRLILRPLSTEDVARALEDIASKDPELPRDRILAAAGASGGSVRHALELLLGGSLEVRDLTATMLAQLPKVDGDNLHTLSDRIRGNEELTIFAETVGDWLAAAATRRDEPAARLARLAEAWEKVRRAAVETEAYNLDRKPMVFQVFSDLAEATRG